MTLAASPRDASGRQSDEIAPAPPQRTQPKSTVVIILAHDRRRIIHTTVTEHPIAAWLSRQVTQAFPWDKARFESQVEIKRACSSESGGFGGLSDRQAVCEFPLVSNRPSGKG
jgi:hypothetical protein